MTSYDVIIMLSKESLTSVMSSTHLVSSLTAKPVERERETTHIHVHVLLHCSTDYCTVWRNSRSWARQEKSGVPWFC